MAHQYQAASTHWYRDQFGNITMADPLPASFDEEFPPLDLEPVVPLATPDEDFPPRDLELVVPLTSDGPQPQSDNHQQQQRQQIGNMPSGGFPAPERRPDPRRYRRGLNSFICLIAQAILSSPRQKLTVAEIFDWIKARDPDISEANEMKSKVQFPLRLSR